MIGEMYKWESEKEIMIEFNEEAQRNHYQVVNGSKLVFNYIHLGAQCEDIIDDEWAEILIFQIENNIENGKKKISKLAK